jgi:hypothetical protein
MKNWKAVALFLGGVLVGMFLGLPGSPTSASTPQYRECVWYAGVDWTKKANNVDAKATKLPPGWTPIGGGGPGMTALLCR